MSKLSEALSESLAISPTAILGDITKEEAKEKGYKSAQFLLDAVSETGYVLCAEQGGIHGSRLYFQKL